MNAGGVDKACKSNGPYFEFVLKARRVAIQFVPDGREMNMVSGERVSNTLVRTSKPGIAHRKVR